MKRTFSFQTLLRVLSILTLCALVAESVLVQLGWDEFPVRSAVALYSASGILLCVPVAHQREKTAALVCAVLILLSSLTCTAFGAGAGLSCLSVSLWVVADLFVEGLRKCGSPGLWFGDDAIWGTAREYARLLSTSLFLLLGGMAVALAESPVWRYVSVLLMSAMYVVLYCRAYTGHTVFISPDNEKRIADMNRLSTRGRLALEDENELVRLKAIYNRSEVVMKEKKPYLDPDFCLDNLTVLVYTNRGQLSRAINTFSGMNFKSYLNRHRIEYALDLIEKDHRLKVAELSTMSGFCTPVSFTMAFKSNVGMLPSDYIREKQFSGKNPI